MVTILGEFRWASTPTWSFPPPSDQPSGPTRGSRGGPCLSLRVGPPSVEFRRHDAMGLTWVKLILATFAETKVGRLLGRTPASIKPSVIPAGRKRGSLCILAPDREVRKPDRKDLPIRYGFGQEKQGKGGRSLKLQRQGSTVK